MILQKNNFAICKFNVGIVYVGYILFEIEKLSYKICNFFICSNFIC